MNDQDSSLTPEERKRRSRRRLLATLGLGVAGAYVAPTLFSIGQAQAWHGDGRRRRSRVSHSRYSRYSRPSRPRHAGHYLDRRRERDRHWHDRRRDDRDRDRPLIRINLPSRW